VWEGEAVTQLAKYHGSPYLSAMIGARASPATVTVMPRETSA
jgi:hypothetical protein